MNCKPGDLARVVGPLNDGFEHWRDKIIRVIQPHPHPCNPTNTCWTYEGPRLIDHRFGECYGVSDSILRPIRWSDDPDETLTWAGKPAEPPVDVINELAPKRQVEFRR